MTTVSRDAARSRAQVIGRAAPIAGKTLWRLRLERDAYRIRRRRVDLALFHDFEPAPGGGAHQSLRAFVAECVRRDIVVGHNALGPSTPACLFNSFNFDVDRFRVFSRRSDSARMVHRVGAVTSLYRGFDDGTDARIGTINAEFAHATIAISHATIDMYRQVGIELIDPHVVYNACDTRIFHPRDRVPFSRNRKARVVACSWSPNPRKGGPTYRWLEDNLDWGRYEFTFIGNSSTEFSRLRHLPPVDSAHLAALLREHDIFLTATEHDAYSNALVEALSCGLPAVYRMSGGSAEAVKDAGFGFTNDEEVPELLDRLVDEYEHRQALISLPTLEEIADGYLDVLGLQAFVRGHEDAG